MNPFNPLDSIKKKANQLEQQASKLEIAARSKLKSVFGSDLSDSGAKAPGPVSPAPNTNTPAPNATKPTATTQNPADKPANPKEAEKARKEYDEKRHRTGKVINEMRAMPGAADKNSEVAKLIKEADEIVANAEKAVGTASTKQQIETQTQTLQAVTDKAKTAKDESVKYVDAHPSNLGDFEKKLKTANNRVMKIAGGERGAFVDADNVHPKLKEAKDLLAALEATARGAGKDDKDTVKAAISDLKKIDALLQNVEDDAWKADNELQVKSDAYLKWSKQYEAAKNAVDRLADDPLAKEECDKIRKLIANGEKALLKDGAAEALLKLGDFTVFVDDAAEKRAKLDKAKPSGPLQKALDEMRLVLERYGALASEDMVDARRDTVEGYRFLALDSTKEADAIKKLGELKTAIETEGETLKAARDQASLKHQAVKDKMQAMVAAGLDPSLLDLVKKQAQYVIERDLAARNWTRAGDEFDKLLEGVEELDKEQGKKSKEWADGAKRRGEIRARAVELAGWAPLTEAARGLVELLNGFDRELKQSFDYAGTLETYNAKNPEEILKKLEAEYAKFDTRPELLNSNLADCDKALRAAYQLIDQKRLEALSALIEVEGKLEGVVDRRANHLRADIAKVDAAFKEFQTDLKVKNPPSAGFKTPTKLTAEEIAKPFNEEFARIKAEALKADPRGRNSTFADFKQKAQDIEKKGGNAESSKLITQLLDQLENMGVLVVQDRKHLADLAAETDPAKQASGYRDFRQVLQQDLDRRKRATAEKFASQVEERKTDLEIGAGRPLKKLNGRHKGYQAYQRELEAQADDIKAMADSGDPYMVEACKKETETLRNRVKAVDPDQRGADATRYKNVTEALDKIGEALGGDIRIYLPVTHRKLTSQLTDLRGETGRRSPSGGLGLLGSLQIEVKRAETRAQEARKKRDEYAQLRKRVEKQWTRVKKLTGTQFMSRATHFADRYSEQMDAAATASETEPDEKSANSGPSLAISTLNGLKETLDTIEQKGDSGAARVALQEQNATVQQDNLFVEDLARDFKLQVKAFENVIIPGAEDLIKEKKGDLETIDNLKASVKMAVKTVQPYLDMLTKIPKLGKAKAPKRDKAEQDFQSAKSRLTAASRTVTALRGGVGTTEVDITGDLKKVEANWRAKTKKYSLAVLDLAKKIEDTAAGDAANEENAKAAAKLIRSVADDFLPNAFAPEINILANKDNSEAKNKPRLAAREKALKIMRANRRVLEQHPVHTQLKKGDAAFGGSKMPGAARDLFIALKRLELEVLVGV